jgi:glycosyltransferase involved in cell wall biosynthesis
MFLRCFMVPRVVQPVKLGINLIVHPSALRNASRVSKIAKSTQSACGFDQTIAVGVKTTGLPAEEQLEPNVAIHRMRGSIDRNLFGRLNKTLIWQAAVFRRFRSENLAVVACHNVWALPMCAKLAMKTGAVFVYNTHELETEAGSMKGAKKWIARALERRYIRRAQIVSVVSGLIAEWYSHKYAITAPVVIRNIPEIFPSEPSVRKKLNIRDSDMLYAHTGNLVDGRSIPLILETFAKTPEAHVVFIGAGPLLDSVKQFSSTYANIHRLPPFHPSHIVQQKSDVDVGFCLIDTGGALSYKFSAPNKLFEALCAKTPVISSELAEVRQVLGPLATGWILNDPAAELLETVKRINKDSVSDFRSRFEGLPSWTDEVKPLVAAYLEAIRRNEGPPTR